MTGICALEGPTGSGKTTFIEAIMLALYGFTPTRLYLPSVVASWDDEPAVIELDFRSSGRQYRVRRELKRTQKTFSHKAFLFELTKGQDQKAISGPKIDDVNKKCEELVGSPEMVLCSVFSSQKDAEHLIELRPAERKELLAKMLSTNKYIVMAEQAKKCVQAESAAISAWLPQADKLHEELALLPADQNKLADVTAQYKDASDHVADAERKLSAAKVDVARIEAANLAHNEDMTKINAMGTERESLREKGRAAKKRVDELLSLNSAEIEAAAERLAALKSERETLRTKQAQQEKEAAQAVAEAERIRASAAKAHLERASAHSKEAGKTDDEFRELDGIKRKKFESIMSEISSAKVELSKAEQDEVQLQKKLALLAGFPDVDACKKCPLAIDGLDARKSLLGAQQRTIEAKQVVAAAETKIEKLEAKVAEKRAAIEAKKIPLKDFMPEERDRIAQMEAEASRIGKAKTVDQTLATKLGKIDTDIKAIGDVESKLAEAKKASSDIERLKTQIDSLREQFKKIEKDINEIKVHDKVDDSEAKGRVLVLAGELEARRKKETELAKEIGKAEAKVSEHEERRKHLAEIEKLVETKQKTASIMDVLAKALGRDGIPQLIFDCTIPQLQANMAILLSEFEDRWTIQVRSQRESKSSGNVQECVDIVVDDGNGERDISTYSGGEVKLLKSVIRIAFATLQAERSGRGVRVLILDEAMDKMDADYSSMFIRMFNKLSKAFAQVFVVSHNDALVASLPNRIFFVRNSLASPVSVKTSFAGEA
jgi:exonuclease SbcC